MAGFKSISNVISGIRAKDEACLFILDEGYVFGSEGEGFERMNIAVPTTVLISALERLYEELHA